MIKGIKVNKISELLSKLEKMAKDGKIFRETTNKEDMEMADMFLASRGPTEEYIQYINEKLESGNIEPNTIIALLREKKELKNEKCSLEEKEENLIGYLNKPEDDFTKQDGEDLQVLIDMQMASQKYDIAKRLSRVKLKLIPEEIQPGNILVWIAIKQGNIEEAKRLITEQGNRISIIRKKSKLSQWEAVQCEECGRELTDLYGMLENKMRERFQEWR